MFGSIKMPGMPHKGGVINALANGNMKPDMTRTLYGPPASIFGTTPNPGAISPMRGQMLNAFRGDSIMPPQMQRQVMPMHQRQQQGPAPQAPAPMGYQSRMLPPQVSSQMMPQQQPGSMMSMFGPPKGTPSAGYQDRMMSQMQSFGARRDQVDKRWG